MSSDLGRVTRVTRHVEDWNEALRQIVKGRKTGSLSLNFNQGVVCSADWSAKPEKEAPIQELTSPHTRG